MVNANIFISHSKRGQNDHSNGSIGTVMRLADCVPYSNLSTSGDPIDLPLSTCSLFDESTPTHSTTDLTSVSG